LPRDAECFEVVVPIGVKAGDSVQLHGVMAIHWQRKCRSEAHTFEAIVILHAIDRRPSTVEIRGIHSKPQTGTERIGDVCLRRVKWRLFARLAADEIAVVMWDAMLTLSIGSDGSVRNLPVE
jgi:hypothetical protein